MIDRPSRSRSPRSGVAAAVAAGLLGLALLLAWQLAHGRSVAGRLDAVQLVPGWPVTWRPPRGWQDLSADQLPEPAVAGRTAPDGRQVLLVCARLGGFVQPSYASQWVLSKLFGHRRLTPHAAEEVSLVGLTALRSLWTVGPPGGARAPVLLQLAVSPTGQAYGLLLETPGPMQPADELLLGAVAQSIELTEPD
jgi:hypothetical protein